MPRGQASKRDPAGGAAVPTRSCARQEKAAIACALPLSREEEVEEEEAGGGGRRRTVGGATRRRVAIGVGGEERPRPREGDGEVNYSTLAISPRRPLVLFGFGSSFWWLQDVSLFLPHHY